jgi:hypothetical protein
MKTLTIACLLFVAGTVPALAESAYDWQSGNSYHWNTTPGGDTRVQGYNLNNGTMWNQTIKPNGDMRGYDGGGNYWQYNSRSGNYYNYGTGEMCTGHGAARICN